jgi:hypothetical protein
MNDDLHYVVVVVIPSKEFAANRLHISCSFELISFHMGKKTMVHETNK